MRLRALRVQVDIGLALGTISVGAAVRLLADQVPMDDATACDEVRYFKASPGQAIAYVVGKVQVEALLAQAKRRAGPAFDLDAFHLWLWRNGNVPLSLLAQELDETGPADLERRRGGSSGIGEGSLDVTHGVDHRPSEQPFR